MVNHQSLELYTKDSFCKIFSIQKVNAQTVGKEIHRHNFYQIILVTKGEVRHRVDFKGETAKAPYLSLVYPNQMHRMELSEDAEADIIMFDETVFCSAILSNELKDYNVDLQSRLNHIKDVPEKNWQEIVELYQCIENLCKNLNSLRKMQVKFMIKIILLKMIDIAPLNHDFGKVDTDLQYYQRFREAVNQHFTTQRKVHYYADLLGISSKTLTNICNKYTGRSPLEIIHETLTIELKKVFVEEGLMLKEIAFRFGFSSQSALNKFIEKNFGCTPQEWRSKLESNLLGIHHLEDNI